MSLANGDYKWRVMDYGAYGYGTNSAFKTFTLNASLLHTDDQCQSGQQREVNAPTQTCAGGYLAGSVVQLTAVPGSGYAFSSWSGGATRHEQPGLGDDGW